MWGAPAQSPLLAGWRPLHSPHSLFKTQVRDACILILSLRASIKSGLSSLECPGRGLPSRHCNHGAIYLLCSLPQKIGNFCLQGPCDSALWPYTARTWHIENPEYLLIHGVPISQIRKPRTRRASDKPQTNQTYLPISASASISPPPPLPRWSETWTLCCSHDLAVSWPQGHLCHDFSRQHQLACEALQERERGSWTRAGGPVANTRPSRAEQGGEEERQASGPCRWAS